MTNGTNIWELAEHKHLRIGWIQQMQQTRKVFVRSVCSCALCSFGLFEAFVCKWIHGFKVNLLPHSRNPSSVVPLYTVLHCDSIIVSYNSFIVDRNSIIVDKNSIIVDGRPKLLGGGESPARPTYYLFKKKNWKIFSKWRKKPNMCAIEIFTHVSISSIYAASTSSMYANTFSMYVSTSSTYVSTYTLYSCMCTLI